MLKKYFVLGVTKTESCTVLEHAGIESIHHILPSTAKDLKAKSHMRHDSYEEPFS